MRVAILALVLLACLLAPPGLTWLALSIWGTPHMVWTYRFHDNGAPYDPRVERHYIDCTYIGWDRTVTVPAQGGRCPWFRLLKSETG